MKKWPDSRVGSCDYGRRLRVAEALLYGVVTKPQSQSSSVKDTQGTG